MNPLKNHPVYTLTLFYAEWLRPVRQSAWVLIAAILMISGTLLFHWDSEARVLRLAFWTIARPDREDGLLDLFREWSSVVWLLFLPWLSRHVLLPLTNSFTVSESLWLRLAKTTHLTLALARGAVVVLAAVLLGSGMALWAAVFAYKQQVDWAPLLWIAAGVTGYVLLTGSLTILWQGKPTLTLKQRHSQVFLVMGIPFALTGLAYLIGYKVDGFLPFAFPFSPLFPELSIRKGFALANGLGLFFLLAYWAIAWARMGTSPRRR